MSDKKEGKFSIDPKKKGTVQKALDELEDESLKDMSDQVAGGQWIDGSYYRINDLD